MVEKLTGKELVIKILEDSDEPMSCSEICDNAIESKYFKLYARGTDNDQKKAQISSLLSTWCLNDDCPVTRYEKGYNGNISIMYKLKRKIEDKLKSSENPDGTLFGSLIPNEKINISRPPIGVAQRHRVWSNYWGNCMNGVCIISGDSITLTNCIIGHIVAYCVSNNSDDSNLAPICNECNKAMGKMDMREYKKIYYPDINVPCKIDIFKDYITKDDVIKCLEKYALGNIDVNYFNKAIELLKK